MITLKIRIKSSRAPAAAVIRSCQGPPTQALGTSSKMKKPALSMQPERQTMTIWIMCQKLVKGQRQGKKYSLALQIKSMLLRADQSNQATIRGTRERSGFNIQMQAKKRIPGTSQIQR
jgi:hypothetical protein